MQKLNYLIRSVQNFAQEKVCPYCGERTFDLVERKYFVTSLLKCRNCGLLHRHPKDSKKFLEKFYQTDYKVDVEMMTDLPTDVELVHLKQSNFSDLKNYLPIIKAAVRKPECEIKMVDYGCSWGYNVFKLKNDGVDAEGFELSVPRARFGEEKLDVRIATQEDQIRNGNDLLFSSHVIEHLHSIGDFVALSKRVLSQNGIFMAFCPNGSKEFRDDRPETFSVTWGSLHPNYIDLDFAQHLFRNNPYLLLTSNWPYAVEKIAAWDGKSQCTDTNKSGYELLIIAKPNVELQ